jgi:WD40 repeat protein
MKALEREPSARYPSVAEFRDDLQRFLDGRAISARPVGWGEQTWRWAKAHPLSSALAGALLATVLIGGGMLALSHRDRGIALKEAQHRLRLSLIDQARAERLLGQPGHRQRAMGLLRAAADMENSQQIRDEVVAVLAQSDLSPASVETAAKPKATLPNWEGDDPPLTMESSKDGAWKLIMHESGAASLANASAEKPLHTWKPADGREVKARFTQDGKQLVLAEVENGVIIVATSQPTQDRVMRPLGPMISFLETDPMGKRLAVSTVEGLEIIDLETATTVWKVGSEQSPKPVRCAPAWSSDGLFIVVAMGDARGITLFDAANGNRRWDQPTFGWPTQLRFHPSNRLIACATDEPSVLLCNESDGRVLTRLSMGCVGMDFLENGKQLAITDAGGKLNQWNIDSPIGFREWKRISQMDAGGTVFGMALSPDGNFLLTTASGGVFVWSVSDERQVGFYGVENQRIDAPTSAWWLKSGREILVQVPGALERVTLNEHGEIGNPVAVDRPPGTAVVDVLGNGDWIVTSKDPDAPACQLWPMGDSTKLRETNLPKREGGLIRLESQGLVAVVQSGDAILLTKNGSELMRLIPPEPIGIRGGVFSSDANRLFLLGRDHRIFTWELERLKTELTSRKF